MRQVGQLPRINDWTVTLNDSELFLNISRPAIVFSLHAVNLTLPIKHIIKKTLY